MSVPELVRERLADEEVLARVALGGDDELLVTPSRTLVYRAEGLLSDESVSAYPHDAERISVSDGRRKSTIHLDHGIEGESEFSIPGSSLDDALGPVLGGVLRSAGVAGTDESVRQVYRLGELTLAITDARVIKHVGNALWDEEYEEFAFEDVTGLDVEAGEVSSQIIIETDHRPQRIKTPSGDATEVRERIERALLAYHDVGSYAEFLRECVTEPEEASGAADDGSPSGSGDGQGTEADDAGSGSDGGGLTFDAPALNDEAESRDPRDGIADEVAALREAVERQNDLIARQQETIDRLIDELRRGR